MGWPVSALFSVVVVGGIGGGGGRGTEWQVQHNAHFLQINIEIFFETLNSYFLIVFVILES